MAPSPESQSTSISDLIAVQASDEAVAKLQLAARWAERFGTPGEDVLEVLKRFRRAHDYIDAVTNGVAPDED